MEEEIVLLKNAYEKFNIDSRENIAAQILKYIRQRIIENKYFIEELIKYNNEVISFENILTAFDELYKEKDKYKKEKNLTKREDGFVTAIYTTSVGVIAAETSDTLNVLKYFIKAIKSRNSIVISDVGYNEESVKSVLLVIFSEALKKFDVDENLIMIIPYEECNYGAFDKTMYNDNRVNEKAKDDQLYIFLEDKYFENEVNKELEILKNNGIDVKLITTSFYDAVEKINKTNSLGAVIYTKDSQKGFKFINLVHTKNAFVNASLCFVEDIEQNTEDELYMKKKIMYELGSIKGTNLNNKETNSTLEDINNHENMKNIEEKSLVVKNNRWYQKIFEKIEELKSKIFKKDKY